MTTAPEQQDTQHKRIIVIDDTESIHDDFRKTLAGPENLADLEDEEAILFGEPTGSTQASLSFEIDSAMQGQEGLEKVARAVTEGNPYALAFVDMRMPPGWDGVETIERLWDKDPNLQVVICTAYSDYSWDQVVERLGRNDRLLILKKPFDNAEVTQIAVALTQKWQATQQARMKVADLEDLVAQRTAELERVAMFDQLTGLPNRTRFEHRLEAVMGPERGRGDFAVLFVDFDRFKIINDSLGHDVGDLLLQEIARRIERSLSEWAEGTERRWMAARLGGDEFVVLLEKMESLDAANTASEHMLSHLRASYHLAGHEVYTTASIGITADGPEEAGADQMIRRADAAMYRAKQAGRDCAVVFDASMEAETLARLELETDLRKALQGEEFHLQYQPIVCVETGETRGVEALVRWASPKRGAVGPDAFIPVAEETGLIVPIGRYVLWAAVRQLHAWQQRKAKDPPLYMSVNLSKSQLLDPGFVDQLAALLEEVPIAPRTLTLEVTESTVMDEAEAVAPILERIKQLGVKLSMDDFGTGHSSLNCLHRFPIDMLKMDRAFMLNVERNREYAAVVQAIVTLAKNLGMQVTAEGVETYAQLAQIQALECDQGQGFLFARPLDPGPVPGLLDDASWRHGQAE